MTIHIVFMGTPEFAVPSLTSLVAAGHDVVGVFTRPDRGAGRGRQVAESAVKKAALAHNLHVYQPEKLTDPESFLRLRELAPALVVVAAYGQILKREVLELPMHGCLNVHPSLLPKYRGASPVAAAILAGDRITGVTIMRMDAGMDTGPILTQAHAPVLPEDTTGTLTERLAGIGADMLVQAIPMYLSGALKPQLQDNTQASYTKVITKEDGVIDWRLSVEQVSNRVRAFAPWPGSYTLWKGKRIKMVKCQPIPGIQAPAGTVIALPDGYPAKVGVGTGEGILGLIDVQMEGKKEMAAADFLRGSRDFMGAVLGS